MHQRQLFDLAGKVKLRPDFDHKEMRRLRDGRIDIARLLGPGAHTIGNVPFKESIEESKA